MAATQIKTGIALDVVDQSRAIRVVGKDAAIRKAQYVAGLSQRGVFTGAGGQRRRFKLERHGDVAATAPFPNEGVHGQGKPVQWNQSLAIL